MTKIPKQCGDLEWVEFMPSAVMVLGDGGRVLGANQQMADLLGRESGEAMKKLKNDELTVEEDRECDVEDLQKLLEKGSGVYHKAKRYLRGNGEVVLAQVKGRVVEDFIVVEVVSVEGGHSGISELVQGYDLLHRIMDRSPFLIYTRDLKGRYVVVNKRYEEVFGINRRDLEGMTPFEILPKESAETVMNRDRAVLEAEKSLEFEEVLQFKGREIHSLTWSFPIYDQSGGLCGVGGMSMDISQRIEMENKLKKANKSIESAYEELRMTQLALIQAEKMESIGRLAAGVAHEVKNPLAMLLMGIDYLDGLPRDIDVNLEEILKEMRTAVMRAEGIVHGLVDFSAQRQLEFSRVDMNFIVDSCLPFLRHELTRDRIKLIVDQADDLPDMMVDVQKFEQVVINLAINAIHAMVDGGGELKLRTRWKVLKGMSSDDGRRTREHLRNGDTVTVLEIEDTGPGIPKENLSRVFDPFFTTKATGEGTGLGLSICKKIIELHHGLIRIDSEEGRGTKISLTIKAVTGDRKKDSEYQGVRDFEK